MYGNRYITLNGVICEFDYIEIVYIKVKQKFKNCSTSFKNVEMDTIDSKSTKSTASYVTHACGDLVAINCQLIGKEQMAGFIAKQIEHF